MLLIGALALTAPNNYQEEFERVKEFLLYALNAESRELVLSGCEMLSNITEAMGDSLQAYLNELLPPILRALTSKKIFIEEKISACQIN